jgi:hypothetical protein
VSDPVGQSAVRVQHEIRDTLGKIDKLYPILWRLTNSLQELGVDLGQPLPKEGGLRTLNDYGRAIIGLGKFLIAIGGGILLMAGGEDRELDTKPDKG